MKHILKIATSMLVIIMLGGCAGKSSSTMFSNNQNHGYDYPLTPDTDSNRSMPQTLEQINSYKEDVSNIRQNSLINMRPPKDKSYYINLATSGGGNRAAAFTAGVMNGLNQIRNMPTFDKLIAPKKAKKTLYEFRNLDTSHTPPSSAYYEGIDYRGVGSVLHDLSIISSVSGSTLATANYMIKKHEHERNNDKIDSEVILRNFLRTISGRNFQDEAYDEDSLRNKAIFLYKMIASVSGADTKTLENITFTDKKGLIELIHKLNNDANLSQIFDSNFQNERKSKTRLIIGAMNRSMGQGFYFIPEELMMYGYTSKEFNNMPAAYAIYSSMAHPAIADEFSFQNTYKYVKYLNNIPYYYDSKSAAERLADVIRYNQINLVDGGAWDNSGADILLQWHDYKKDNNIDENVTNGHLLIVVNSGRLDLKEDNTDNDYFSKGSKVLDLMIDRSSDLVIKKIQRENQSNLFKLDIIRSLTQSNEIEEIINYIERNHLHENLTKKKKTDLKLFYTKMADLDNQLKKYIEDNWIDTNSHNILKTIVKNYAELLSATKIVHISFNDIDEIAPKLDIGTIPTKMGVTTKQAIALFEMGSLLADHKREEIQTLISLMPKHKKQQKWWVKEYLDN